MSLATKVLAALLALQEPGASPYSLTPVPEGTPAACAGYSPLCAAPWWSREHRSWVRPETWEEGLHRYWVIAQEVAAVALWEAGRCPDGNVGLDCSGALGAASSWPESTGSWGGVPEDLAELVSTVIFHESGFRRDVHSGVGKWAKGDQGRSRCLGQLMTVRGAALELVEARGWKPKDLLGVDAAATRRCLVVVADGLIRVHKASPWATFAAYGGVSAGAPAATKKRLRARVATLQRMPELMATPLEERVIDLLDIEEEVE